MTVGSKSIQWGLMGAIFLFGIGLYQQVEESRQNSSIRDSLLAQSHKSIAKSPQTVLQPILDQINNSLDPLLISYQVESTQNYIQIVAESDDIKGFVEGIKPLLNREKLGIIQWTLWIDSFKPVYQIRLTCGGVDG